MKMCTGQEWLRCNVSHPGDEISPQREKSESNNARQGRSLECAGSSIKSVSGFPSRAHGRAISHIFKQQPVCLCQRRDLAWEAQGEICRERLLCGVNCRKQLERLSWRFFFFFMRRERSLPSRPRRHKGNFSILTAKRHSVRLWMELCEDGWGEKSLPWKWHESSADVTATCRGVNATSNHRLCMRLWRKGFGPRQT